MSRVYQLTPGQLLAALGRAVGTGEEPDGLCADRSEHRAHLHDSESLGRFWCTADQSQREPGRSQRRLDQLRGVYGVGPTVHQPGAPSGL